MLREVLTCYSLWGFKFFLINNLINNLIYFINFPKELINKINLIYLKLELSDIPIFKRIQCNLNECKIKWFKEIIYKYRMEKYNNKFTKCIRRRYIWHCEQNNCHNIIKNSLKKEDLVCEYCSILSCEYCTAYTLPMKCCKTCSEY